MSVAHITLGILLLAVLTGVWRILRLRGRWMVLRCLGQVVVAAALWLLLFPPSVPQERETAIVLTPGVDSPTMSGRDTDLRTLALPGVTADADTTIERVPDLATALRRHPSIGALRILGDGLPARDRAAVDGLGIRFEPDASLIGVVGLEVPYSVNAGALWSVRGKIAGVADATVELRDHNDALLVSGSTAADGHFELRATAKSPGVQLFRLRMLRSDSTLVEEVPVPIVVRAGDPIRTLIVAGAADAELKYLRRWVLDSGKRLSSRISLSRGIEQRQDAPTLDVETLAETDVLIIDERAWAALSTSEKSAILSSVDDGLGVLLRVTGPVPATVVAEWARLGLRLESTDRARAVELAGSPDARAATTALTRWPVSIDGPGSAALASSVDGSDLGRWSAHGQGRVGVWLLLDSYRLLLGGESPRFGTLWSDIFSTLGRARGRVEPKLPGEVRVDQRSLICGITADARIEDADAASVNLLPQPGEPACASWWPSKPGWHTLVEADQRWPIYVLATDQAQALRRARVRAETASLVHSTTALPAIAVALPRWPLFLVWLLLASGLWWLERRALPTP